MNQADFRIDLDRGLHAFDEKLEQVLHDTLQKAPRGDKVRELLKDNIGSLNSPVFKGIMATLGGFSVAGSSNDFEVALNTLSTADHIANGMQLLGERHLALAGAGKTGAYFAKALTPAVAALTTAYDAFNAGVAFYQGDYGGGIGKGMQALGGAALMYPYVGWGVGAVLLGGGMIVDAVAGEDEGETQLRQLLEKRVEDFSSNSTTPESYTIGDQSRFAEIAGTIKQIESEIETMAWESGPPRPPQPPSPFITRNGALVTCSTDGTPVEDPMYAIKLQAYESQLRGYKGQVEGHSIGAPRQPVVPLRKELSNILSGADNWGGVGDDDHYEEMLEFYTANDKLPDFSSDAVITIEKTLYELQSLLKDIRDKERQRTE